MAATDLIYNTVDPVLFTPDYSFLRYTLDKSQSRYDQGLDAVSNAYNNLKRPVTDPTNGERRDQFLKDAQGQLQKIASSDLSLAENVGAANNVFEPLATNQAFLFDAYHTDRINKQLSIMDEWAKSTDPTTRKQYSPEIQQWVARDLNVLKNGKGDINNYKGMENRSAFAYVDAQDILDKAAKDKGFKFKIDSVGQPYIVTTEGGTAGVPSYKAFAQTVLGGDPIYQRQLQILSQNDKESLVEAYKKNPAYSGKSDSEIYYDGGFSSYDKHRTSSKSYIDDLNNNFRKEEASLSAYYNNNKETLLKGYNDVLAGNSTSPEAMSWTQFLQRKDNFKSLKSSLNDQTSAFNETFGDGTASDAFRQQYAEKFAKDPQSFYADQRFKNDIQRFSDIRASSLETKITPDSAYVQLSNGRTTLLKDLADIKNQLTDNSMDVAKLDEKKREFDLKSQLKGEKSITTVNADGTTTTTTGTSKSEISAQSASSYVLYTINAINKLNDKIVTAKAKADNSMTSAMGGLTLLNGFGLDNQSTGLIKSAFTKQINAEDPSKSVPLNKEEKNALGKAFHKIQAMASNAGIKIEDGEISQLTMRTLPDYMRKAVAGYTVQNENEMRAKNELDNYFRHNTEINQATSDFNKGKQAVISKYSNDPEFTGMFVSRGKDANGKEIYDMKGKQDIANEVAAYYGRFMDYDQSGKPVGPIKFSKEKLNEIAQHYIDGTINASQDNVSTSIFKVSPEKYQELIKKINKELPIPDWTDQQGMMLANPRFVVSGSIAEDIRKDLDSGSQTNANIWQYSGGTAEPTEVDPNLQKKIRVAMADKDNIAEISIFTGTAINQGGTSVSVKFKDRKINDDKKQDWEGQEYFFPISINQTTPTILQKFATVDDVGDFAYYRNKGEDYVMNAFEADGIKAILHPNKAGSKEGYIEILYKPWNQTKQSYGDWTHMDPLNGFPIYDENVLSPNEIKDLINEKKIFPYVKDKISRNAAPIQNNNVQLPTLESLLK
jgi:hypothetical protein